MRTTAKHILMPALLGAALVALPAASPSAFAWGSGGHGGGGHGGGGHGGNGGGEGSGRVGSLIHDCKEGSYQFWCRNKQFKVRKGGGHYHASRRKVRVHYKQRAIASRYEYTPSQRVVVYEPQLVYARKVIYEPQVVYKKKVVRRAKIVRRRDYHTRPSYRSAPAPYRYEGPVMTTQETVHTDYDGHGVLVYRPVKRAARHKPRRARRHGHYRAHKRTYRRKHHHKRQRHKTRGHGSYRYQPVLPAYHPAPSYHYSAQQPVQVYVVKRRRIHKKIPLFGSKSSVRRKTVRGRYRTHRHRRACTHCGHAAHKKSRY